MQEALLKIDNLITELSLLSNTPSIIGISETWAQTDNDILPIPGYSYILKSRKRKFGGGVALYLQDKMNIKYKQRPDLSIDSDSDSLFIQIKNKRKDLVIGVIYKPPDIDLAKFNENI